MKLIYLLLIITSFSLNFSFLITNVNKNNSIKINSRDKTGNLTEKNKDKIRIFILWRKFIYCILTDTDNRNWIGDNFKLVSDGTFWYLTENTWNEIDYYQ